MEERTGASRALFDQCEFGGLSFKATRISGTIEGLNKAHGTRCTHGRGAHGKQYGLDKSGTFRTKRLQSYPSLLCKFLAECIVAFFQAMLVILVMGQAFASSEQQLVA